MRLGDSVIGTTKCVLLLTLLNERSNDVGDTNPLESKPLSKPRQESQPNPEWAGGRLIKADRAAIRVARVVACTR